MNLERKRSVFWPVHYSEMTPPTAEPVAPRPVLRLAPPPRADVRPRAMPAPYELEPATLGRSVRSAVRRHTITAADCVAVGAAVGCVLAAFASFHGAPVAIGSAILTVVAYHMAGGYERIHTRFCRSTLDEIPSIFTLAGLATLLEIVVHPGVGDQGLDGWRTVALLIAIAFGLTSGRVVARTVAARLIGPDRCLVVGTLTEARRIDRRLKASGASVKIVGALTPSQLGLDMSVEEVHEAITTVAADFRADRLIMAASREAQNDMTYLIRVAKLAGLELSVCSPLLDTTTTGARVHHVAGLALLAADPGPSGGAAAWLSRAIDIAVSMVVLLISSPLLALIALAIKLDSPGPILFRQVRVGRRGAHFQIFKFRSMVTDAEAQKAALRDRSEVGAEMFKLADDPRITGVGRFLRKSSLDELPQLLNVLRGDMRLVGPRPLVIEEDAIISGIGRGRLRHAPGMTGPWQVMRERVAQAEMLEIDYSYVTNWSLWSDFKILARTALHVMRSGNV